MARTRQDSERERSRLPTREQVEAMTFPDALKDLETALIEAQSKVEVDLEFWSGGDEAWEARARGYLTAVRATLTHVRKRIHRLTVLSPRQLQARDEDDAKNKKAARRLAHEQEVANTLARRQRENEALQIRESASRRKLVERIDFFHHWHRAAHDLLTEEQCRAITSAATKAQVKEIEGLISGD